MKRRYKFPIILLIVFPVLIFILFVWFFIFREDNSNDKNLMTFAGNFQQIPLPAGAKSEGDVYSYFGLLPGSNGNHCDYLVAKTFSSNKSENEIKIYYQGKGSISGIDGKRINLQVDKIKIDQYSNINTGWLIDLSQAAKDFNIPESSLKTRTDLFLVYAKDVGYPASDSRCH